MSNEARYNWSKGDIELSSTPIDETKQMAGECEPIMIISNGIEDDVDEDEK